MKIQRIVQPRIVKCHGALGIRAASFNEKEVGKYMQKGRDYVVEDGDIINFLFTV